MISVIVVTYNSEACLARCLDSLAELLEPEDEVIVVDNASADGTSEVVSARPTVRWLPQDVNLGFGSAVNVGARAAGNPLLLLVNPDVTVTSIDRGALSALEAGNATGLFAGRLVGHQGEVERGLRVQHGVLYDAARLALSPLRPRGFSLPWPTGAGRSDRQPWVVGALVLVGREEFLTIGGFNERLFLYGEDRELSARYRNAGIAVGETGAIVGHHDWGTSSDRSPELNQRLRSWAILSWVEFLSSSRGGKAAKVGWTAYNALASAAQIMVKALARVTGRTRLVTKSRELAGIADGIDAIVAGGGVVDGRAYCPDARRIVAGRSGRGRTGEDFR